MTSVFFANQGFDSVEGSMVERSNTLVLGTNLFGGLGSNPSRVIILGLQDQAIGAVSTSGASQTRISCVSVREWSSWL